MKKLIFLVAAFGLTACSPNSNSSSQPPPAGLCTNIPCKVSVKSGASSIDIPGEVFYAAFESRVQGSCADQANMSFNTLIGDSVASKEDDGFATIRLDLNPDGTYTGFYIDSQLPFGTANPGAQPTRAVTKLKGNWHLGSDKIVVDDIGIGHRAVNESELLFMPLSSSPLHLSAKSLVSFTHVDSRINADGKTVEQYCADQAVKKSSVSRMCGWSSPCF